MSSDLADRQRRILSALVVEFIDQGEPVSSAWLAEHSDLGLSPATVRNILARLEEQGLVQQPHTSAGRIPTDQGYRLYVDGLLGSRKRVRPRREVEAQLRRAGSVNGLLEGASQFVSHASHQIGFVLARVGQAAELRHIEFVGLDGHRVLVIVVATDGQVIHKIIEVDETPESSELEQAAAYLNHEFVGMTIEQARAEILERLDQERTLYDALLGRALRLARSGLSGIGSGESLHVNGAAFLVDEMLGATLERDRTLETLRALFRMIEEKHRLIDLLTQYIDDSELTVVIGSEHDAPDLHPFSVVASIFRDGRGTGTVGVIGPRRMRYRRAIAVVDGVSQVMTRVLEGQ